MRAAVRAAVRSGADDAAIDRRPHDVAFQSAYVALEAASSGLSSAVARRLWRDLVRADASLTRSRFSADPHPIVPCATVAGAKFLRTAVLEVRDEIPLVFPSPTLDDRRRRLWSTRARLDRVLGELLASAGEHDLAIDAAFERWRVERDGRDVVRVLDAAGRRREAFDFARAAASVPDAVGTEELRKLVDRLFPARNVRRADLRRLEADFLARPTAARYAALREAVVPEQRPRTTSRVLGALQRVRREPDLVFTLYLDEGRLLDADGMVPTQRLSPEALCSGAERILAAAPALATGWLLVAALRTADDPDPKRRASAPELLLRVRDLCAETGRAEDFRRALALLRSRHSDRPRFLALLRRSGL